jgi:hypothetical protein
MVIITEGMVTKAVTLVRPTALTLLRTKGLTWGPKFVEGNIGIACLPSIAFGFGTMTRWDPKWGEEIDFAKIAQRKRRQAQRVRANTSTTVAAKPWILWKGDYLYSGGVYRDGIAVGVSGAYGWVDEAIGTMLIDVIVMLAHLEVDKRVTAKQMQL